MDVTWPAAVQTAAPANGDKQIVLEDWQPEANILWRWLGIRPVFHLPCSFTCEPTVALGTQIIDLA